MLKKFIIHLWTARREFAKYFIIGFSAFTLDIGSLYLLKERLGLNGVTAVAINQPFLLMFVFFLNKHWSFGAAGLTKKQMRRFLTLAAINYVISLGWMWLFNHAFGFNAVWARTGNIVCAVGWNFLLYKHWVYAISKPNQPVIISLSSEPAIVEKEDI